MEDILELIKEMGIDNVREMLNPGFEKVKFEADVRDVNERIQEFSELGVENVPSIRTVSKNFIISSPTQVGKTQYIIDYCRRNKNNSQVIILTCANSIKQKKQLKTRLIDNDIQSFSIGEDKNKKRDIIEKLNNGESAFILMLNNASQISKLEDIMNDVDIKVGPNNPDQIVIFHDEADTINKADAGSNINDNDIALSHRGWVGMIEGLEKGSKNIKRFWVSATPENCSSISGITGKNIITLPVPKNYINVSEHIEWNGEDESGLEYEIERIRYTRTREVILYCCDRTIVKQIELAKEISKKNKCLTVSYNSKATKVYKNGECIVRNKNDIQIRGDISNILDILQVESEPIVIIGYDLMDRGISFVAGGRRSLPSTATVMFYNGEGGYAVGIAQRFGRICGTSRPDLKRRVVYCNQKSYNAYNAYLKNQQRVFQNLRDPENENKTMLEILDREGCALAIGKPLDRPTLKNVNTEYKNVASRVRRIETRNLEKMKRLIDSWRQETDNTAVSRLFREMIENGGEMESSLVREIVGDNQCNALTAGNHPTQWALIFKKENGIHRLRDEAIEYYTSL